MSTKVISQFSFLGSNRFWVLVIGCLAIVANGNFSVDAWTKAVIAFATGFITIRTADRATETPPKQP